jgi:hypothetical protein
VKREEATLTFVALASMIGLIACDELPTDPSDRQVALLQMDCEMNPDCTPPGDPAPSQPGYFYPTFSADYCMSEFINDVDHDGLDDSCEYALAMKFAPMLSTSIWDEDVSREPYWAARPHEFYSNAITIIYMLSYYRDNGPVGSCSVFEVHFCQPHAGDSEFIVAFLVWDSETEHWVLNQAFLSAHYEALGNSSRWVFQGEFEYPGKTGGYPRVYVSRDKHANYVSVGECDDGGYVQMDVCDSMVDNGRVFVGGYRNIGSSTTHLIDATVSPRPGYPSTEYYWTGGYFCGWQQVLCETTGYHNPLGDFGFGSQ